MRIKQNQDAEKKLMEEMNKIVFSFVGNFSQHIHSNRIEGKYSEYVYE